LPSQVGLTHGGLSEGALLSWELRGDDGTGAWIVLAAHKRDRSLKDASSGGGFPAARWAVSPPVSAGGGSIPYCSRFRVVQTGPNSSGDSALYLSGMEIYGELRLVTQAAKAYRSASAEGSSHRHQLLV